MVSNMSQQCFSCEDSNTNHLCDSCKRSYDKIKGALENLVKELRNAQSQRFVLGMKLSVGLNVAERALKISVVDRN